jgi:site-specific DNA recombinase
MAKALDIYVRVSRVNGREGDSFISPAVQEEKCRAMATAKGYEVGRVFDERDRSGGSMAKRDELDKALQRIYSGQSGGIIVQKLDRFARNVVDLLQTEKKIREAGGVLVIIEPTIDTADPAFGKFLLTLFGGLAELELGRIRASWKIATETAIANGKHIGATPFGYKREGGKIVPEPDEADLVRRLFKARADGGTWNELLDLAESSGLHPRRGRGWTYSGVRRIVAGRVYLGEAHGKADAHPAIVDRATWNAADRVKAPGHSSRKGSEGSRLTGLLACGTCGYRMGPEGGRYRCQAHSGRTAGVRCKHPTIVSKSAIDAFVVERFLTHYDELLGDMEHRPKEPDVEPLRHGLAILEGQLEALIESKEDIPPDVLAARSRVLRERVEEARSALAAEDARTAQEARLFGIRDVFAPVVLAGAVERRDGSVEESEHTIETPIAEQRRLLTAGIERITVQPGRGKLDDRVSVEFTR